MNGLKYLITTHPLQVYQKPWAVSTIMRKNAYITTQKNHGGIKMFCVKCGNKMIEGAAFCTNCGAKSVVSDTTQQIPSPATLTDVTPVTTVQQTITSPTVSNVSQTHDSPICDNQEFREFVDNHVRTTTKFQSAKDLLDNAKPLKFVWVCLGISFVIGLLTLNPLVILILLGFLGFTSAWIIGGIIRFRYCVKTSGEFVGGINMDDLLQFLNENLSYLQPYLHGWGYLETSGGTNVFAHLANAVSNELKEISICTQFGPKQKQLAVIVIRPHAAAPDSGRMQYTFYVENNGITLMGMDTGFPKHVCLFKTVPILQAAMEYYLKSKGAR